MRSVEKEAFRWADLEIFTVAQAEAYINESERREQEEEKLRRELGIKGRTPTATERRYMESWLAMGFRSEVLALAYDRTVVSTGRLSWAYMDKIVRNWQEKGLYTVEDIEKGDPRADRRKPAAAPAAKTGGDDLDRLIEMYSGDKEE
jgi:DnaD/phage-associated family protein